MTQAVRAVTQVPAASLAEANEKLYTSLTYGIALEQDRGGGRKSHTVRFLDFDDPGRNDWIVTRQYKVLGAKKHVQYRSLAANMRQALPHACFLGFTGTPIVVSHIISPLESQNISRRETRDFPDSSVR